MAKSIPVDRWRTMYWIRRLLERTKLGVDALAARVLKLADPGDGPLSLKRQLRLYLEGKRTASIAVERRKGASWVVLADRLAPGSFWDFCHPLFDLLEELYFWHDPQAAHERFQRRTREEAMVASHCGVGFGTAFGARSFDWGRARHEDYNRLRRIRRAMLAIERLPPGKWFVPSPIGLGLHRRISEINVEAGFISPSPTLDDFCACLALSLEAAELTEIRRYYEARELLLFTQSALDSSSSLEPAAGDIRKLLTDCMPAHSDFMQSQGDTRIARTAAPLDAESLASRPSESRQLAISYVDLHVRTRLTDVAYVFL